MSKILKVDFKNKPICLIGCEPWTESGNLMHFYRKQYSGMLDENNELKELLSDAYAAMGSLMADIGKRI